MSVERSPASLENKTGLSVEEVIRASETLPPADLRGIKDFPPLPQEVIDMQIEREHASIEESQRDTIRSRLGLARDSLASSGSRHSVDSAQPFVPPEELKKVMALPRAERKAALPIFKEKLQKQRESLGTYRNEMERILLENPDTPKQEVLDRMKAFEDKQGFSPEANAFIDKSLDRFYSIRKKNSDLRRQFPNDRALAEYLIGKEIPAETEVEVTLGPLSLNIYTTANGVTKIAALKGHKNPMDGFTVKSLKGKIDYIVLSKDDPQVSAVTLRHEQQHLLNDFFKDDFARTVSKKTYANLEKKYEEASDESPEKKKLKSKLNARFTPEQLKSLQNEFKTTQNDQEKKEKAVKVFTLAQKYGYDQVKDELFSYVTDPTVWPEIGSNFTPESGSSYDYLKDIRDSNKDDPIWAETSQKMLVTEYTKTISKAVDVITNLKKLYNPKEIIALLSDVPLENWPKAADRIYQEKLKDPTKTKLVNEILKKLKEEKERIKNGESTEASDKNKTGEGHGDSHAANDNHDKHGKGGHGHDGHGGGGHGHGLSTREKIGTTAAVGLGVAALIAEPGVIVGWLGLSPVVSYALAGVGLGGIIATWLGDVATLGLIGNVLKAAWDNRGDLFKDFGGAGNLLRASGSKAKAPKAANDNHGGGGGGHH